MKFVFLTLAELDSFPAAKRAVGMGESLAVCGHDVIIAALTSDANKRRLEREAPHCKVSWFRKGVILEVIDKLCLIWHLRPDIVYSPVYSIRNLAFLRWCVPLSVKVVFEFNELYSAYGCHKRLWRIIESVAAFESDGIVAASKVISDYFESLVVKLHLRTPVLYSPYAYPEYLHNAGMEKNEVGSRKAIVMMSALYRAYGVYDVISACCLLRLKRTDFALKIIGGGPELSCVRRLVVNERITDWVEVLGYVPEKSLAGHFRHADVFVSPLNDSFQDRARCPSKVFYYIPFNKPIVTCALGNPYEILGDSGVYYAAGDINDMSRAFDEALDGSQSFRFPDGFIGSHSWSARAEQFVCWLNAWDGRSCD